MQRDLLNILSSTNSENDFELKKIGGNEWIIDKNNNQLKYKIENDIPRFVEKNNYSESSFGFQWNTFYNTQLDSFSKTTVSKDRFYLATNWTPDQLKGKWILDVGCGMGRFAEVALQANAFVVCLDYSSAIDAAKKNLGHYKNVFFLQGDIYKLPFKYESFDYIYSLGVLQHTPDPENALKSLYPFLKKGGRITVDFYEKHWKSSLLPKYWLRPITRRIQKDKLFTLIERIVPILLPFSIFLSKLPFGNVLKRIVPIANLGALNLPKETHIQWSILDTFDWLSPEFDNPATKEELERWLRDLGLNNIEVLKAGHLVGRGIK